MSRDFPIPQNKRVMPIKTQQILAYAGFKLNESKWLYSLKNEWVKFSLSAVESVNRNFVSAFIVSGILITNRAIEEVYIELPLQCESLEQGLAYLAYGLRNSNQLMNHLNISWYQIGVQNRSLLPFIRAQKEREDRYNIRSHCYVDRDLFRVIRKKLLKRIACPLSWPVSINVSFDGRILHFEGDGLDVDVPAQGAAWNENADVSGSLLVCFPKRFQADPVPVDIFEGYLRISQLCFPLISKER